MGGVPARKEYSALWSLRKYHGGRPPVRTLSVTVVPCAALVRRARAHADAGRPDLDVVEGHVADVVEPDRVLTAVRDPQVLEVVVV
jgi:hypothetical protein